MTREFSYDHGHKYDNSKQVEVNSLLLTKDLNFVTTEPKRLFDLNNKNKTEQTFEQANTVNVEPYSKALLKVYVTYYDITIPFTMNLQSLGVDQSPYNSYG